jgi:hypothetical protein
LVTRAIELLVFSGRFVGNDITIGRERVKLAQLFLSAGNLLDCETTIKCARNDLEPFLSGETNDPDWIEVCNISKFLSNTKNIQSKSNQKVIKRK